MAAKKLESKFSSRTYFVNSFRLGSSLLDSWDSESEQLEIISRRRVHEHCYSEAGKPVVF